jgi:hypothetical protein
MTQMSDPRPTSQATTRGYPLARALHACGPAVLRVVPVIFVGCIVPPALGVEQQDAGVNSPPAIVSVRSDQTELQEPGPYNFEVGSMSPLNLTLLDTDVNDKLYVRVFVDYQTTDPTAPRSLCTAASVGQATRTATCPLQGLCLNKDVGDQNDVHLMQVVVFDRQPLETGDSPLFQAMPLGGLSTDRAYQIHCLPSS